ARAAGLGRGARRHVSAPARPRARGAARPRLRGLVLPLVGAAGGPHAGAAARAPRRGRAGRGLRPTRRRLGAALARGRGRGAGDWARAARGGADGLNGDELADRLLGGATLEAHDEAEVE